ncbi:Crp/Fnr family transcriptional regulator [Brevibacillus migulae]|uniref:Crp/Fnr family transcriptional regulator n=1 Tax=Brevibacillus migulae TaxID=1644114 RepID=UPI00106EC835|nr:cyclic nucleotide-binding domain-containing protein [Brevibacillus migulae]
MKEMHDPAQLMAFLQEYQIESIWNESLLPHMTLYSFEQGEKICTQGEAPQYLYILVKGKLKIYTTSAEGKTLILSFKKPLEVIGDVEYVRGMDIINTVEAVTPVRMIGVHHRWLRKYGSNHAPLLHFLLNIITEKFAIKSSSMSFNLMYPVEVRLASYLLSVCYDETDVRFQGCLSTTNLKDAANLIGTSYRHVNRVIQQFCEEGLTERQKGYVIVKDRVGLSARACENIYE